METDAYDAAQSIFRGTFDLADIVFLIILLFLLLCSALASASEVAYFSLSPGELEKLKESQSSPKAESITIDHSDY